MALISKMNRCAVCGSSEVVYDRGSKLYHCGTCGADSAETMPAADVAAVNRIVALGDTDGQLEALRRRYANLDIASWSKENRLQTN